MTLLAASPAAVPVAASHDPTLASFGHDPWWLVLLKVVVLFAFLMITTLFTIWAERRVIGRMQQRPGPNRAGKFGLLQSLLDGIKLPLKEDIIPRGVDKLLFVIAPAVAVIPVFISISIIPFGPVVSIFGHQTPLQLADLPVAVLLVLAMSSMAVYGIVLAGWSSASPYSLLGGLRSSAQVISYEIAMGLSFVPVFLYAGSLSTSQIVAAQAHGTTFEIGGVIFHYPSWFAILLLPSFVIYLITMVGETNRLPFDLPEGEGELVGGYHTEYSSLKFALFYLAEYISMITVSALAITLFLGGWRAPWPISVWDGANSGWWPLLWFLAKIGVFLFVFIWLRGSLPRIRYDQLMALGWKVLIPVSLAWTLIIATMRVWRRQGGSPGVYIVGALIVAALLALWIGWETSVQKAAKRAEAEDEALAAEAEEHGPAFPVPPLDLPHYHGIGLGDPAASAPPPAAAARNPPPRRRSPVPDFLDPVKGFGVTFRQMFRKVDTVQYPEEKKPTAPAVPRPPSAQPVARRAGEVHRLRAVRLGLPGRRHLRRGRGQHPRGAVLARRAVRAGLPDQLPALHPVRAVRRGVPDPGADHDQRLRAGRRQPRGPDLDQGAARRAAVAGHGGASAPHAAGRDRGRLLPAGCHARRRPAVRRGGPAR